MLPQSIDTLTACPSGTQCCSQHATPVVISRSHFWTLCSQPTSPFYTGPMVQYSTVNGLPLQKVQHLFCIPLTQLTPFDNANLCIVTTSMTLYCSVAFPAWALEQCCCLGMGTGTYRQVPLVCRLPSGLACWLHPRTALVQA